MSSFPTYDVRIDWANNGTFTDPGDDITRRVLTRSPVTIAYGRDQARSLAPIAPGRSSFEVDNRSRDYSPENASSPLAGKLQSGRPVQIAATFGTLNANPTFESGVDGWSPSSSGTFTRSTSFAHQGTASGLMAPNGASSSFTTQVTPAIAPAATAGVSYTATAWLYSPAGYGSVQLSLCWINSANSVTGLASTAVTAVPAGTWTQFTATGTAPAGTARVGIRLGMSNVPAVTTDQLYVDEVRVSTAGAAATPHVLFRGFLDDYDVQPARELRSVQFSALDALARLSDADVSTALLRNIRTGTAVGAVLDSIGWPADARDIDAGGTTMPWWWEEGTDAWTALNRIISAEGPGSLAYVGADGKFVFRDRHHRLTRTASTTVQATFRDKGTEPLISAPMGYDAGWKDIVNAVSIPVDTRAASLASEILWQSDDGVTYSLTSSAGLTFNVQTSDPFLDANVDLTVVSGTGVRTFVSRVSGQSTIISVSVLIGSAKVTGIQLRARPVTVVRTDQVTGEDATSIGNYGRRSYGGEVAWVGAGDAQAIVDLILAQRANRAPVVTLRILNANDTRLQQQLTRDLSDRIHIVDSESGLDADAFIEQIQHSADQAGRVLETQFGCEKIISQLDSPATIFILDSATNGILDTNLLAH